MPPVVQKNDTWEGAMEIPFSQASRLKHPRFVANPPKIPISRGYYADDMTFSIHRESEKLSERRKRGAGDYYDDDDWIDLLRIQGKEPENMKKEFWGPSEHKYVEGRKQVFEQFGHRHKMSQNDWKLMRGKAK